MQKFQLEFKLRVKYYKLPRPWYVRNWKRVYFFFSFRFDRRAFYDSNFTRNGARRSCLMAIYIAKKFTLMPAATVEKILILNLFHQSRIIRSVTWDIFVCGSGARCGGRNFGPWKSSYRVCGKNSVIIYVRCVGGAKGAWSLTARFYRGPTVAGNLLFWCFIHVFWTRRAAIAHPNERICLFSFRRIFPSFEYALADARTCNENRINVATQWLRRN